MTTRFPSHGLLTKRKYNASKYGTNAFAAPAI